VFQAWEQMQWAALPQVIRQAVFAGIVLLIIRRPEQVSLLAGIELLSVGLAILVNLAAYNKTGRRIKIDLGAIRNSPLLKASMPIGGSQLIWAVRMYLPTIVLGMLVSQVAVGLFAAPHRLIMVGHSMLTIYFTNIFPYMSQVSYASNQGFARLLRNSLRLLVWPCLALALGITFFAPALIGLVFGGTYMQGETITVLSVLVWLLPVLAWRGHSRNALIAMDRQADELLASIWTVVLLLITLIPSASIWGPVGVAWAMVLSEVAGAAITWQRLKQNLPGLGLFRSLFSLSLAAPGIVPVEKP
jgi:O-antigen/teichoic acid export membrane protein